MTAQQIVNQLLEVYGFPGGPPAGSPEDPWRKGGHKPLKFKRGDFEGKRPVAKPEEKGPEDGPVAIKHKFFGKHAKRFNWKPPQNG